MHITVNLHVLVLLFVLGVIVDADVEYSDSILDKAEAAEEMLKKRLISLILR